MEYLIVIISMILGLIGVISPETSWKIERGWLVDGAETSERALFANRILGGILIVIAMVVFIFILNDGL